jgi:hypothetical protein
MAMPSRPFFLDNRTGIENNLHEMERVTYTKLWSYTGCGCGWHVPGENKAMR